MSCFIDNSIKMLQPECPYNGCYGVIVRDKDFPNQFHCNCCFRKVVMNTYETCK